MNATNVAPAVRDARAAAASWRPQKFTDRGASEIVDPLIEPLWNGLRVVALVEGRSVELRDLDGDPVEEFPAVVDELAAASRTPSLVLDGYLTHQPVQDLGIVALRDGLLERAAAPSLLQMWFGAFGRGRRSRPQPAEDTGREPIPIEADVALVVVDLLWLDDEPLLDVPLLERKRILESAVGESNLVRHGIYVRAPIDSWLGSWRAMGFSRLAYKAANSRYRPGETNPQWALADLPSR